MPSVKELEINNTVYDVKGKTVVDNNSGELSFWSGSKAQYDAIVTKDANTLYNITDDASPSSTVYSKAEVDSLLQNALYYKTGDIYSYSGAAGITSVLVSGCLTSSKTNIFFSIFLPKSVANISAITINSLIGGVRGANGGYIITENTDFSSVGTLTVDKSASNYVTFQLNLNSASSQTNNIPVSVMIHSISLSFL